MSTDYDNLWRSVAKRHLLQGSRFGLILYIYETLGLRVTYVLRDA